MKRYLITTLTDEYIDSSIVTDLPLEEIKRMLVPEAKIEVLK